MQGSLLYIQRSDPIEIFLLWEELFSTTEKASAYFYGNIKAHATSSHLNVRDLSELKNNISDRFIDWDTATTAWHRFIWLWLCRWLRSKVCWLTTRLHLAIIPTQQSNFWRFRRSTDRVSIDVSERIWCVWSRVAIWLGLDLALVEKPSKEVIKVPI